MTLMGVVVSTLGLRVNTSSKEQGRRLLGAYMAHMMSSSSFSTLLLETPPPHTQLWKPSSPPSPPPRSSQAFPHHSSPG